MKLADGDLDEPSWEHAVALLEAAVRLALIMRGHRAAEELQIFHRRTHLAPLGADYVCTYAFRVHVDDRIVASGTARLRLRPRG